MASSLHACHSSFRSWTGLILTYHFLKYVRKCQLLSTLLFQQSCIHSPTHRECIYDSRPFPFLYPQTQISVKLVSLSVQVAKLCCSAESVKLLHRNEVNGAAQSGPKSRSKWHVSAWTDRLVERVHWTLSGMDGKWVELLQHRRDVTTWSDSYCINVDWQWQCIQYQLTVTTYNNMEWQWLLQHGMTVTVTTWSDSDWYKYNMDLELLHALYHHYNQGICLTSLKQRSCYYNYQSYTTICFTAWYQVPHLHSLKAPTSRSSSISTKRESKRTRITTKRWNQVLWRATCMRPRQLQGTGQAVDSVCSHSGLFWRAQYPLDLLTTIFEATYICMYLKNWHCIIIRINSSVPLYTYICIVDKSQQHDRKSRVMH